MNWTTELIDLYRSDIISRRDSRISQILGDELPTFPESIPFFQHDKELRNSNIIIESTEEEIIKFLELKEIPNNIFQFSSLLPHLFHVDTFKFITDQRFTILRKGRQLGISNLILLFVLQQILTENGKKTLILSNKKQDLIKFRENFLTTLKRVPLHLQKGIQKLNKLEMIWEDKSILKLRTVDNQNWLSQNYDNIILLDASFFKDLSMILNMIVPPVSSRTNGRIIIEGNILNKKCFFNDLCNGNKFPFQEKIVNSMNVPFRDENWENQQIQSFGLEIYLAEFMCLIPGTLEYNRQINLHQLLDK